MIDINVLVYVIVLGTLLLFGVVMTDGMLVIGDTDVWKMVRCQFLELPDGVLER